MGKKQTELAVIEYEEFAIAKRGIEEVTAMMRANAGAVGLKSGFDLPRITVPTGGGTHWMIPGLAGNEPVEWFEGIMVHMNDARRFYKKPFDQRDGREPPNCMSSDGFVGVGDPGGTCIDCPLAQWGSDPVYKRGQACDDQRHLYIIRKDELLPTLLVVPPGSIGDCRKFFIKLTSQGTEYWTVIARFGLTPSKNWKGVDFSKVSFSVSSVIKDENHLNSLMGFRKAFTESMGNTS